MNIKSAPIWISALLVWLGLSLVYTGWWLNEERAIASNEFQIQSRILHRLLTQRAEQHEAIFAALIAAEHTFGLPTALFESFSASLQRGYPQISSIERYEKTAQAKWQQIASQATPPLDTAVLELAQKTTDSDPLTVLQSDSTAYRLLRSSEQDSVFAIRIATDRLLQPEEMPGAHMSIRLSDNKGMAIWQLAAQDSDWPSLPPLVFHKPLASHSQPFLLTTEQPPLPSTLPWTQLLSGIAALLLVSLLSSWALEQYRHSRVARRQLALAQASRINTMGELAAGIAHELNQPLAAMLTNSQALANFISDEPADLQSARQAAANMSRQAKRAGAIVHRLRQFMSADTTSTGQVELRAVVESALTLTRATFRRQQIKIHSVLPSGLPPVLGDEIGFEQVLVNLLLNAAEAMQEQPAGLLNIKLTREGQWLRLDIEDSGPGLSTEAASRLFDPFFTTKKGGLGLGLTICSSIIEQANGEISVSPGPDGGCLFSVRLPIFSEDPASE